MFGTVHGAALIACRQVDDGRTERRTTSTARDGALTNTITTHIDYDVNDEWRTLVKLLTNYMSLRNPDLANICYFNIRNFVFVTASRLSRLAYGA